MTLHTPALATSGACPVLTGSTSARARLAAYGSEARAAVMAQEGDPSAAAAQTFVKAAVGTFWQHTARNAELRAPFAASSPVMLDPAATALANHIGALAATLSPEQAGDTFGRLYTALLPDGYRAQHGSYYTPSALAEHLLDRATEAKPGWTSGRTLDPACGCGALLLPALRRVIEAHRHVDVPTAVGDSLRGYDLDPFAAWLTQVMVDAALLPYADGRALPRVVEVRDALAPDLAEGTIDLVIMNPPYGQTRLAADQRQRFARSTFGRANLYGLFLDQATRLAREGGAIVSLTPASFLGGEYSKRLREVLATDAPPVAIDFLVTRTGVFDGVLQECVVTTTRKGAVSGAVQLSEAEFRDGEVSTSAIGTGDLPHDPSDPWLLPRDKAHATVASLLHYAPDRLRDWGYRVYTGQIDGSRTMGLEDGPTVPLLWGESIDREAGVVWPEVKRGRSAWISSTGRNALLVHSPCVLLKRTTAREQARRLVAAPLSAAFLAAHPAVAVENHLNVLAPCADTSAVAPEVVAAILNSEAADKAFRCLSGSTNVSAYEVDRLPLPPRSALSILTNLVASQASTQEIEAECARLYEACR